MALWHPHVQNQFVADDEENKMVIKNTKIVIITIKMKRLAKSYNSLIMKTTHT